jgi:hypothetical protein
LIIRYLNITLAGFRDLGFTLLYALRARSTFRVPRSSSGRVLFTRCALVTRSSFHVPRWGECFLRAKRSFRVPRSTFRVGASAFYALSARYAFLVPRSSLGRVLFSRCALHTKNLYSPERGTWNAERRALHTERTSQTCPKTALVLTENVERGTWNAFTF